jgi:hypothetical protein
MTTAEKLEADIRAAQVRRDAVRARLARLGEELEAVQEELKNVYGEIEGLHTALIREHTRTLSGLVDGLGGDLDDLVESGDISSENAARIRRLREEKPT